MAGVSGNKVNSILNGMIFANSGYTTGFTGSNAYVVDGSGTASALGLSTAGVMVNGTFKIGSSAIAIGGNVTFSGAYATTFTLSGATSVTFPTSGTLVSTTSTTLNSLTSASSLATVGTIGTGVWHGTVVTGTYGGTGVNNGTYTITVGGNYSSAGAVTWSGAYAFTGTLTAATTVTFPTTGTLATLAGTESLTNKTLTTPTIAAIKTNGGSNTFTLPTSTDTAVGRATTDTLTNKTLTTPILTSPVLNTGVSGTALAAGSDEVTGTSATLLVTPSVQHKHASSTKAWVSFAGGSGTITSSYNVSGVVRNSTGNYTVSFTNAFSSTNTMCPTITIYNAAQVLALITAYTASSMTIVLSNVALGAVDATGVFLTVHGTLA